MKTIRRILKFIKIAPGLIEFVLLTIEYLQDRTLTASEIADLSEKGAELKAQIEELL